MIMLLFYSLLILSGIAAFVAGLIWLLHLLETTQNLRHPCCFDKKVRLTFAQFIKLYSAAPTGWTLGKYYIHYQGNVYYSVAFSLYSSWQYRRWMSNKDRRAARMKKMQDQVDFIADIRSALAKADAQHQADMRRKLNSLWD